MSTHLVEMACAACGRPTFMDPSCAKPACLDCLRSSHGLDDRMSGVPIGRHVPKVARICSGEVVKWPMVAVPPVYGERPAPPSWPERDPLPEVTTRDPWPQDTPVPGPVAALEAFSAQHGWLVRPGYSRGPERAVRVGTYKITESIALWAAPHPASGWRFVAEYAHTVGKSWSWRRITIWRPGLGTRFHEAMRTDLTEFVQLKGMVLPTWFKSIHAREEAKRADARLAARNRPKPTKEGSS